jgi:hypothetical protein
MDRAKTRQLPIVFARTRLDLPMSEIHKRVISIAAKKAGLSVEAYQQRLLLGLKRCSACKTWLPVNSFTRDSSRVDGLETKCRKCRTLILKSTYVPKLRQRFGPVPDAPRDGDKRQARRRINVEVRTGKRPHPNLLPCVDCGHIWHPGERRHEYDHSYGYGSNHHYAVESVCTICHARRTNPKRTHCIHGHKFSEENTIIRPNGHKACRECRRIYDQKRRVRGK